VYKIYNEYYISGNDVDWELARMITSSFGFLFPYIMDDDEKKIIVKAIDDDRNKAWIEKE